MILLFSLFFCFFPFFLMLYIFVCCVGNEEGGFGWIAFNYLKKIIGPKKSATAESPYAVVEMGGASAQVSQMAPTAKDVSTYLILPVVLVGIIEIFDVISHYFPLPAL